MVKCPFERVASLIDRKKILEKSLSSRSKILIKTIDGKVGYYQPMYQFEDGALEGQSYEGMNFSGKEQKIITLMNIAKDRYFMNTTLSKTQHGWKLHNSSEFFMLNRRIGFRVSVPVDAGLQLKLTHVGGAAINRSISIVELSVSGTRIYLPEEVKFKKNVVLRGTIEWKKTRNLPIEIQLVHSIGEGIWGAKFINKDSLTSNRLKMLSVEIQQSIYA